MISCAGCGATLPDDALAVVAHIERCEEYQDAAALYEETRGTRRAAVKAALLAVLSQEHAA